MKLTRSETSLIGTAKEKEKEREKELVRELESKTPRSPGSISSEATPEDGNASTSDNNGITSAGKNKLGSPSASAEPPRPEENVEGPPRGHIFVEKGEKCFAFFVRCTTRKHAAEEFQELVGEMHNLALYWPFIDWEMSFLDPGGTVELLS